MKLNTSLLFKLILIRSHIILQLYEVFNKGDNKHKLFPLDFKAYDITKEDECIKQTDSLKANNNKM